VLINGKEQQVPVETGLTSDTETEITSGLKEGDTVIVGVTTNNQTSQGTSPFSGGFGGTRGGNAVFRGR
jgi:multidrug efflux pump subunit AcrA (membrane-fusion protein)